MSSAEAAVPPLRFECPACGVTLTVPGAAAGLQGPCPRCWQEIVSPNPALGIPARLPAPPAPPPPALAEPFAPPLAAAPPPPVVAPPAPPVAAVPSPPPLVEPLVPPVAAVPPPPAAIPEAERVAEAASAAQSVPQVDVNAPTPTPVEAASLQPETPPAPSSSKLAWVAGWIVTALAFASAGYYFGILQDPKRAPGKADFRGASSPPSKAPDAPKPGGHAPPSRPTEPPPAGTASGTAQSDTPPPVEPPPPAKLSFDATLRAFLEAPDWKTRSKHVLLPEETADLMAKRAAKAGDGPIQVTGVSLEAIDSKTGNHIYTVRTAAIPDGYIVSVDPTDEGPKVNWQMFIGFHEDDFRKFSEGPAGSTGTFFLFVKPDPPAEAQANPHFARYRLATPMPNREQLAWLSTKSTSLPKLQAIFEGRGKLSPEDVERQTADKGVALVLTVEKKANSTGATFFEITDYLGLGWGPRPEQ